MNKWLTIILAVIILVAVVAIAWFAMVPGKGESYSEFYILDSEGTADNLPSDIALGESGEVLMSIINREHDITTYKAIVRINGTVNKEIGPIVLPQNDNWTQQVSFTPVKAGTKQKVEFLLYKNEKADPYLSLNLWINVK